MRRYIAFLLVFVFGVVGSYGQSKQFKASWKKLIEPVFFQAASLDDKLPFGETTFKLFGFSKDHDFPADFLVKGDVINSQKGSKEFTFKLKDAVVEIKNAGTTIKFEGSLFVDFNEAKGEKKTNIWFFFGEGKLMLNGKDYITHDRWNSYLGLLRIKVDEENRNAPGMIIDTQELNLPSYSKRSITATNSDIEKMQNGDYRLSPTDADFLRLVVSEPSKVQSLPEYCVTEAVLYDRDHRNVVEKEIVEYSLGKKINLSNMVAVNNGQNIRLTVNGPTAADKCDAVYTFKGLNEIESVNWNNGCVFRNDNLTRTDGSQLTGIKFDKQAYGNKPGAFVKMVELLTKLTNPELYIFDDYVYDHNMQITGYVAPGAEMGELLEKNTIPSVAARIEAEREAERKRREEYNRLLSEATSALQAQQVQLANDYPQLSSGQLAFTLNNNQTYPTYPVKVYKFIFYKEDKKIYELVYAVHDGDELYRLCFDEDGDYYYVTDSRAYYFTRFDAKVRDELDRWRSFEAMRAFVETPFE